MKLKRDSEANSKIIEADLRGDSIDQMKQLYIEQNTFGIDLDTPIFRIVEIANLLSDISNKRLTHTRIGPMIWGDPAENPLLSQTFTDEVTGSSFTLESLVGDMFGVCWSLLPNATSEMWGYFSYYGKSVRIQSTPRQLLEGAMDLLNPHFMLQHFVGKIEYVSESEFDAFFEDEDFTKYLDSLGQGLALSVLKLPNDASPEQEVRLVYQIDRNQKWTQKNTKINGHFVTIPFCWDNVINNIVAGPMYKASMCASLETELRQLGICNTLAAGYLKS